MKFELLFEILKISENIVNSNIKQSKIFKFLRKKINFCSGNVKGKIFFSIFNSISDN